ncbi:phosphotransferase [Bacillus sp. E(2018)]|uniref:phosphotransferase n=1 Tax=Bacillus sp. E(2018) TaxID=2502239 RepID=UPI0010F443C2|nr:phosphotransferase [Bacillus sp. E(2018)]
MSSLLVENNIVFADPVNMHQKIAEIRRILIHTLNHEYSPFKIQNLDYVGNGVECVVFKMDIGSSKHFVVKVPWQATSAHTKNERIRARRLIEIENKVSEVVSLVEEIPVALPIKLFHTEHLDFLITEHIENDESTYDDKTLGKYINKLHKISNFDVEQTFYSSNLNLSQRIVNNLKKLKSLASLNYRIPSDEVVKGVLFNQNLKQSLLHMDIRPANVLSKNNEIVGLIDWTNYLIGDPGLEFIRIDEYDLLSKELLVGYGDIGVITKLPLPLQLLYRLDTVSMLALVFIEDAPDVVEAKKKITRLETLMNKLMEVI